MYETARHRAKQRDLEHRIAVTTITKPPENDPDMGDGGDRRTVDRKCQVVEVDGHPFCQHLA